MFFMNDKIRQHLIAFAEKNNWSTDDETLIEILTEGNVIHEQKISDHRWWYTVFCVTNIDGMLIGYNYARANRDEHVRDLGWEFDENMICEVMPVQKTITVYQKLNAASATTSNSNMNIDPNEKAAGEVKQEASEAQPAEQATTESAEEVGTEG